MNVPSVKIIKSAAKTVKTWVFMPRKRRQCNKQQKRVVVLKCCFQHFDQAATRRDPA